MTEEYRLVSDRQWRYLHQKINYLTDGIASLKHELLKPKRGLRFWECIPPSEVCKDALDLSGITGNFIGMVGRLADYYKCDTMGCFVDTSIDPKYNGVYSPSEKTAYSRTSQTDKRFILHEFFHHLIVVSTGISC